ncbi:hypothetical protein EV401DRAFT_1106117 [Pisolithus croceorrhizus]|nr:hypothetical protein EV401DRAFT_1106117 [Pisolithus croceorrhizus]
MVVITCLVFCILRTTFPAILPVDYVSRTLTILLIPGAYLLHRGRYSVLADTNRSITICDGADSSPVVSNITVNYDRLDHPGHPKYPLSIF